MKKQIQTKEMVLTGLGMAIVFVATLYIKIPNALDGYFNLGDGFILLFASILDPFLAFLVGGFICDIGELISNIFLQLGFQKDQVSSISVIIMVFLGALLTGVGIYDKIASYAGAGTVVPITGFANAIVATAIEFNKEA